MSDDGNDDADDGNDDVEDNNYVDDDSDDEMPMGDNQDAENGPDVNGNACPICLVNARNAVMVPCGHSACFDCANTVMRMPPPRNKCGECRMQIQNTVRVFGMA